MKPSQNRGAQSIVKYNILWHSGAQIASVTPSPGCRPDEFCAHYGGLGSRCDICIVFYSKVKPSQNRGARSIVKYNILWQSGAQIASVTPSPACFPHEFCAHYGGLGSRCDICIVFYSKVKPSQKRGARSIVKYNTPVTRPAIPFEKAIRAIRHARNLSA